MTTIIHSFVSTFDYAYSSVKQNASFLFSMLCGLWIIQIMNALSGYRLNVLGIYPRRTHGLLGIIFSPFLHGSNQHLLVNSVPLFVLSALVLVAGKQVFFEVTFLVMLVSGLVVWMFGRPGFHVGASSLVLGYWGFLLFYAYENRSVMALFLGFLCLYYFSGLVFSLFPQGKRVSWEGHLAGFLSGGLVSYLLSHAYL